MLLSWRPSPVTAGSPRAGAGGGVCCWTMTPGAPNLICQSNRRLCEAVILMAAFGLSRRCLQLQVKRFRIYLILGACALLALLWLLVWRVDDNAVPKGLEFLRVSRDPRRYVRPEERTALVSPPPCADAPPLRLLMLVTSAPANAERRQAIRETWGTRSQHARLVFVLGRGPEPASQPSAEVLSEAQRHDDLVVEDFTDAYENLTLKTLFLLKWAVRECPAAAFVLKTDDDMLINTRGLVRALPRWVAQAQAASPLDAPPKPPQLIFGYVYYSVTPYRDRSSKWYLPRWLYPDALLPDMASGTGYAMTRAAAAALYAEALRTPLLPLEDVFLTGVVGSSRLHMQLIHTDRFWPYNPKVKYYSTHNQPCLFHHMLTLHGLTAEEIRWLWRNVSRLESTRNCGSWLMHLLGWFYSPSVYRVVPGDPW